MSSKTTISHYAGTNSTPAWSETEGSWTRNIAGIGTGLCVTQTNGGEAVVQLANLHGDIVGTSADNSGAESATLTSEPTAFGVPTTTTSSKYAWLGSGGLQTEFSSGVAAGSGGAYVPQLGIYLEPAGLSGAAAQDPVNEYLADMTLAEPTSYGTSRQPGVIEQPPANKQIEKEFEENPPWDKGPSNAPEDPIHNIVLFTPAEAIAYGEALCNCAVVHGIGNAVESIADKVGVPGVGEVVEELLTGGLAESIGKALLSCGKYVESNSANRCALEYHSIAVAGFNTWLPTFSPLSVGACYYFKKSFKGEKRGLHCKDGQYYKPGSY
jgi:hypothetical protein